MLHKLCTKNMTIICNDNMLEKIDEAIKEKLKKDNSMFLVDLDAGKDMFRVHYNNLPTYADINSQWSNWDIKNRIREDYTNSDPVKYYNEVMNTSISNDI